jgi:hypothetical protein
MLDFNEIRGSTGNSSLLMDTKGHRIFFSVDNLPGYIEIKRSGWSGFTYACIINNARIPEATEVVADDQGDVFAVKIVGTTTTQDEHSEHLISWYIVQTTRLADGAVTTIHRRFRDFAEYNSQVKQNFKGHHLRDMLPPLPEKPLKSLTDHKDPQFILDRQLKLETFLIAIVAVPHVAQMVCTKAFVGLMDRVKEYSVSFHVPQLGLSLIPYHTSNNQVAKSKASPQEAYAQDDYNTPVVVGSILKPDVCVGITPGDTISKINGVPVAGTNFQGIIARIKLLPRPILIHFISVIGGVATATAATTATATATAAEHADEAPRSSAHETTTTTTDHESSPLDQGPRGKKPDLFDGHHHHHQQQQPFHHPSPVGKKQQPQQPQQHQGPSQSEVTAAKQAELSEASRKALEALKQLDEGDDDLLFGKKKTEGNVSLFGARRDVDEDLFGPVVKKAAASTSTSTSTSVPVAPSTPTPSPVPVPVASPPPPVAAPVASVPEGKKESETPAPAPVPVVERSIWDDDVIEIAAAPAPAPVPTPVVGPEPEPEANREVVESSTPVVAEPPISEPIRESVETAPEAPASEEAAVDIDVDADVAVSEPPLEEESRPKSPEAVAEPSSDVPEPSSSNGNNCNDDNTDDTIASVQIDPFADDFVEEKQPEEATAVAPVVATTEVQPPAPPAPLGWDD